MNIAGKYIPKDILNVIFNMLYGKEFIKVISLCRGFYRNIDRRVYLAKKLIFARKLIRYRHGPIYLIQKYNDFEFLEFYLQHKNPYEGYLFDCQDNKKLYDYLITRNPYKIMYPKTTIIHYDDVESMKRLNIEIKLGEIVSPWARYVDYPEKIILTLLPEKVKKRGRSDQPIIPGFDFKYLLLSGNQKLLDEFYSRFSFYVESYNFHNYLTYPVSTLEWLNRKNLVPNEIIIKTSYNDIKYESLEYLKDNGVEIIFENIKYSSRFLEIAWFVVTRTPELANTRISDICTLGYTYEWFEYYEYYFNCIFTEEKQKQVKVKHCTLYFYCFCHVHDIKVRAEHIEGIKYGEFIGTNSIMIEKGIEILKDKLVPSLINELYMQGYAKGFRLEMKYLEDKDGPRLIKALSIYGKEEITNICMELYRYKRYYLLDSILATELKNELTVGDCRQFNRIIFRLGKCKIGDIQFTDEARRYLENKYKLPIYSLSKILIGRETPTEAIDRLNIANKEEFLKDLEIEYVKYIYF
jgi:hypothetical protein